ncbi:MAG TPA: DUF1343 domain-containing protein [Microlunatus sp.]|nr:DUF1343 domain-containing protein [Microlunatus sp.]
MSSIGRRGLLMGAGALAATPVIGRTQTSALRRGGRVRTGADVVAAEDWREFRDQRVGVITNPTGVLSRSLVSIVDAMVAAGVVVGGVFGPEHGFRGAAQAGSSEDTYVDERTGVTVYDAYGADAAKFARLFAEAKVQTVIFDIQDVGARFYTYIWTMYDAMIAAGQLGLRFVILDRPNPVGGRARGPLLVDGFTSGVGKDRIVQQHGMTAGEFARYANGVLLPAAGTTKVQDLDVIMVEGWRTDELFADTGLPWILPSPNMPTPQTALLYPGTCLFEATNLSEGRGTTKPFELIGAPYVDYRWAADLTKAKLRGVEFREAYFTPTFSKHVGVVCGGVQVHVTDPATIDAIAVATQMMVSLRDRYDAFAWRTGDNPPGRWIDLLTGSGRFRTQLDGGASAAEITAAWKSELAEFDRRRRPYLLYRRNR